MAKRRSIYDSTYQTPLADFLEQIPQYYLQLEQINAQKQRYADEKAFRDTQYANQIKQQQKNNEYRIAQAENQERNRIFDNHTKLMEGMPDYQKAQYIENVLQKDPMLKDYMDFSQFQNFSKNIKDANTEYDNINANVDDFRGSSTLSMFPRYSEVVDVYQQLQNIEKSVRGTDLESSHAKDLIYVGDLKKQLETLSGREMAEKDMPPTLQEQFNSLVKTNDADYKAMVEAQDELAQYAVLSPQGKWVQRQPNKGEMESSITMGFSKAKLAYDNSLNRFQASKFQRNNFTKQQGLFYPEIQTAKQLEELDRQAEARTSWFNENESYINQDPASAELALQYLDDPTNADRFSALQESVANSKSNDEFMAMLDKEIGEDEAKVTVADNVGDNVGDVAGMGADITDEDVDDVLADVRKTTGFYPEGDAPSEPEPKKQSDLPPQVPPVLTPLTARSNKEVEKVIEKREKANKEAELFPETSPPVSLKSLRDDKIVDSKGDDVSFENAQKFNKQIDSMYKEIQNVNKSLRQGGLSREKRELENARAKLILDNLVKALSVKDINATTVKEKNIKAVASNFLKSRKIKSPQDLQRKILTLLQ